MLLHACHLHLFVKFLRFHLGRLVLLWFSIRVVLGSIPSDYSWRTKVKWLLFLLLVLSLLVLQKRDPLQEVESHKLGLSGVNLGVLILCVSKLLQRKAVHS